ncbi:helix-hairpin-helix domain-containing protein [Dictyobacter arantiisoli]|uniref:Crossover junction endonuclease MUS81-like HHH domain-containing protein n=1 Tax=Dictyobacter arantiisoli TaxID=2014874 RepID=A0A5A5TEU5_9CHLR|nr:helix-hairpin-helix domain-containing protein [Dictyobacter arantiisoli]GCF09758.1 hypothetical protein KDI_33220 [Dictyobacter arantiisoli]
MMSIMQVTQTIHFMPTLPVRSKKKAAQPMLPGLEPESTQPETAKITNRQIAEVLAGIAEMIEGQNGNPYRVQAYRNAARGVLDLTEPAANILERGERLPIPGLGTRLNQRISELVTLGSMTINNGFCMDALPMGVRVLMSVEHIGPYTAIRLYQELGIETVEQLLQAANRKQIRQLAGFGIRSEARLKAAAEQILTHKNTNHSLGGAA